MTASSDRQTVHRGLPPTRRFCRLAGAVAAGLALAGCAQLGFNSAPVEFRGSTPGTPRPAATPGPDAAGSIIAYDGYEAAVARDGDTVSDVAQRVGLSGGELGAYNGLQPTTALRAGDELVLPPRPGGYGGARVAALNGATGTAPGVATDALSAPGDGRQRGVLSDGTPITAEPLAAADGSTALGGSDGGFSVEALAAAIDAPAPRTLPAAGTTQTVGQSADPALETAAAAPEAAGTAAPGEGALNPPPSSSEPLPPEPSPPRTPASPELGRTQTDGPEIRPAPATTAAERAAEAADAEAAAEVARADTATGRGTAEDLGIRFRRPVSGEVLVPYNISPGTARNEGVDFAADPGSPIVAAADGEVALVSQSLGGLGTIVLIRHPNDVLTVYGRVADVSVSKGSRVASGQQIGVVAQGDGAGPPKMHFEIRRGAESVDPEDYI